MVYSLKHIARRKVVQPSSRFQGSRLRVQVPSIRTIIFLKMSAMQFYLEPGANEGYVHLCIHTHTYVHKCTETSVRAYIQRDRQMAFQNPLFPIQRAGNV
jgi:hypothetical protein